MSESESKTTERVLKIFDNCREEPTAPFDQSHFLDYLTEPPKKLGGFRDSFTALRRYNKFVDAVQLEFTVHFSVKDRDTNFSVDSFASRVEELRRNPNGSLRSQANAMKHSDSGLFLFGNIFAAAVLWLTFRLPIIFYPLATLAVTLNLLAVRFMLRSRQYHEQLRTALVERKEAKLNR